MNNKKWGRILAMAMATALTVTNVPLSASAEEEPVEDSGNGSEGDGYSLVWSDEFDGDSLNTDDWNVEEHEPGWVNSEWQRYTSLDEGNIKVEDGALHIIPKYTSSEDGEETGDEQSTEKSFENFSIEVNVGEDKPETDTIALQINFGKINGESDFPDNIEALASEAEVTLKNISLTDETDGSENLLKSVNFENSEDWNLGITDPAKGTGTFGDGEANIKIDNAGDANWNIQLQQDGIRLIPGHKYVFSMDAASDIDRVAEVSLLDPANGYNWYGGGKVLIKGSGASENVPSGESEITSGRINTQGKHDFKYGRFEARAKVPVGDGFLPAFWLMATDEQFYGQWPKCGEIDIMEVMGQETNKSYHTIHYGYDQGSGHNQNQGTKTLQEGSFSDDYHDFVLDWEPGKMTWYVDGEQVYETSDWYTGTDDDNQVTYPAPFDQDFYIILNLAVGGSWVGNPDLEAINGKEFAVDYVRVYQKDESVYEQGENEATRPEKEPVTYREADSEGNYVLDGTFNAGVGKDADDAAKNGWVLHFEPDAKDSTATVNNNEVTVTPSSEGKETHSIQLKQAGIPMYKGWEYELSFDAYSTEDRKIVIDVEGPDRGWTRYMQDTVYAIGTAEQHYTYNFTMNEKTDPNGSLEFNLGKQGSLAPVIIKNVKLVHVSGEEVADENEKVIRPDGNYVYNGSFDQGDKRLGYWEFDEEDAAQISVTNKKNDRQLMVKVEVPEGASEANPVAISQTELAPLVKGQYELTFSAFHNEGEADGLKVNVVGEEFIPALTSEKTSFSKVITLDKNLTREESGIEFVFTKPGTYYLDDVFLTENALLKNGSFDAGLAGWSPYIDGAAKANYVIDSMNGNDNAFAITIEDTGKDNDWYIQLNQDGLKLEEGKYYYIAFKAKTDMERTIKYSLQQNGGEWTNYSNTGEIMLESEWNEFTHAFQMTNATDNNTRFNITFGALGGNRIERKHNIYIDDIVLTELTKEEFDKINGETQPTEEPTEEPAEAPGKEPENKPSQENPEKPAQTGNESQNVSKSEVTAPVTQTDKADNSGIQTKVNNNGKADKGEIRVTKSAVYKIIGKNKAGYRINPNSDKKNVTVPSSVVVDGAKVKVTKLVNNAFKGNKKLKKVTLGKNIVTIGKGAFKGCKKLRSITVKGDKLAKVEKSAFKDCKLGKNFKVIISAKDDASYDKVVKLFKDAGLTDVSFIRK
ncbi:carbohydrate binding domain-containing protein [Butyrivibrio sp. JL13D10]|uniref:carbohydrate binding domain-containing protein n=1 Tax=Butyrivibrio sp. JL13D10 TaxID=3236815 RepID=UPI0038B53F5A